MIKTIKGIIAIIIMVVSIAFAIINPAPMEPVITGEEYMAQIEAETRQLGLCVDDDSEYNYYDKPYYY